MSSSWRSTYRWQKLRAQVLREESYCHLCGGWVDVTISGRLPLGPHVDHIIPDAIGGARYERWNVALSHSVCNLRKGDGRSTRDRRPLTNTSRDW